MTARKNDIKITVGALIVLVFLFVASGPMYILSEREQAIVARFGRIIKTEYNAGLKFKVPIVDKVTRYPKKIMAWDGESQRIPTREKLFVWVDATARWKIVDPAKFYASVTTITAAQGRLNEIIESSLRTVISQNFLFPRALHSNSPRLLVTSHGKRSKRSFAVLMHRFVGELTITFLSSSGINLPTRSSQSSGLS